MGPVKGTGFRVLCLPLMANVNQKGVIGLVKVTADLVTRGFEVFTPISDACPVDLIAANDAMTLRRIQVKYREPSARDHVLFVSLDSVVNGRRVPINLSLLDGWAIYCPQTEKVYYVRRDAVSLRSIRLCLQDSRQRRQGRLATDFMDPASLWF